MIAAIHQPNFFPWTGYFKKAASCDVFIFLDEVQFSKGSWSNRVRFLISGEPRWVTCPIVRAGWPAGISEIEIYNGSPWRRKLLNTIHANYAKTPHFKSIIAWIEEMVYRRVADLGGYNIANIQSIAEKVGIQSQFIRQSELPPHALGDKKGSALLAAICRQVGADVYLAGDGSQEYEDAAEYAQLGITLLHNNFQNPPYTQTGSPRFTPGLSILDALLNIGTDGTARLLRA